MPGGLKEENVPGTTVQHSWLW